MDPLLRKNEDPSPGLEVEEFNGKVVRLDAVIASPPKIPRQNSFKPMAAVEHDSARHGESREWGRAPKHSLTWILGSGIGISAVVVFSLMMLPRINQSNAAGPRPGQIGLVVDTDEPPPDGIEALNAMVALRPQADALFTRFALASNPAEILKSVRDPGLVAPLLEQASLPLISDADWTLPADTHWGAFENAGRVFGLLDGPLPDFSRFRAYLVLDDGGQLRVDWKATTAYGSADFEQLSGGSGDPSEIRAWISPSGFYTAVFPESDFQSFQLIAPDQEKSVWCYTRRGDPADLELSNPFMEGEILDAASQTIRVTVRLTRGPADSLPNQWLLEELLHHEWITP